MFNAIHAARPLLPGHAGPSPRRAMKGTIHPGTSGDASLSCYWNEGHGMGEGEEYGRRQGKPTTLKREISAASDRPVTGAKHPGRDASPPGGTRSR